MQAPVPASISTYTQGPLIVVSRFVAPFSMFTRGRVRNDECQGSLVPDVTLTHPLYISSISFSILFQRIDVHNAAAPTLGSPLFLRTPPPTNPALFIPDSESKVMSIEISVSHSFPGPPYFMVFFSQQLKERTFSLPLQGLDIDSLLDLCMQSVGEKRSDRHDFEIKSL